MPDGTVPSSTEALRAALTAAKASLETQLRAAPSDGAEEALQQVQSALRLLPAAPLSEIADVEWSDTGAPTTNAPATKPAARDAAEQKDNLTRIRGIDAVLAKRLAALGIHRFAQLAAWEDDDVRVIADAMGLGRRFLAMGIVEQARALERHKAEAAARASRPLVAEPPRNHQAVAVWSRRTDLQPVTVTDIPLVPKQATQWRPLEGEELRHAIARIRTRQPMNRLVCLPQVVPELAMPIYIATDHDASIEVPRWRTGVLVPLVEARTAPELNSFGNRSTAAPMEAPAAPRTIIMAAPLPEPKRTVTQQAAPATAPPAAYDATANRIASLEATLEDFVSHGAKPDFTAPRQNETVPATPTMHQQVTADSVATEEHLAPPAPNAIAPATEDQAQSAGMPADAEEAEVEIIPRVRTFKPLLAPLPNLPLTRKSALRESRAAEVSRGAADVEEAAVVIVKRHTAQRSAADLAFYKTAPPPAGPVRRLMRALAGA